MGCYAFWLRCNQFDLGAGISFSFRAVRGAPKKKNYTAKFVNNWDSLQHVCIVIVVATASNIEFVVAFIGWSPLKGLARLSGLFLLISARHLLLYHPTRDISLLYWYIYMCSRRDESIRASISEKF